MYFGRYAHQKFPREWLLRIFPSGSAELQVIIYRILKSLLQLIDRRALKGTYVSRVDHFSVEHTGFFIQFNSCLIARLPHGCVGIRRGTT
jgi:hypothetical protein